MAIDFSTVNWLYVTIMAVFAFVASLLGGLISFRNRIGGALLAAILFAAMYVVWNYYPHPQIQLPPLQTHRLQIHLQPPPMEAATASRRNSNPKTRIKL